MKIFFWLMVMSAFIGAEVIAIDLGFAQLSLFRGTLFLLSFHLLCSYLYRGVRLRVPGMGLQARAIKFYFIWFVYSFLSLAWVQDYQLWLKAIFFVGSGFLCIWVTSHYLKTKNDIVNAFGVMWVMVVLHNVIGWTELLTGVYRFVDVTRFDRYNQFGNNPSLRVPISMFSNPNDFATFLLFGIFIAWMLFFNIKSRAFRLVNAFVALSSTVLLMRTLSRANILALICGSVILIYMRYFRRINVQVLVLIIAVSGALTLFPSVIANLLYKVSDKIYFSFDGGSDFIRLNLIRNGLYFLTRTFGLGTGAGNIEHWMRNESKYYVGAIENIHNWWAEILVGYGLLIFTGYLYIFFRMAKVLFTSHLKCNNQFIKNTSLSLFCIMIAFSIGSVSSSSNIPTQWLWLFWGIVIAYIGVSEKTIETAKSA